LDQWENQDRKVHGDPPEILVLLDTQVTREKKEPQGNLALKDLWVLQVFRVYGERKDQRGHRESRARKVTKVPLALRGTKEMLDQWDNEDSKDRLAQKETKETGALLVFRVQKENVLLHQRSLYFQSP